MAFFGFLIPTRFCFSETQDKNRSSALVKAWMEHQVQIALYHLPNYNPKLNPDERLNRAIKSKLAILPAARDEGRTGGL